jgi:hypothetical protein
MAAQDSNRSIESTLSLHSSPSIIQNHDRVENHLIPSSHVGNDIPNQSHGSSRNMFNPNIIVENAKLSPKGSKRPLSETKTTVPRHDRGSSRHGNSPPKYEDLTVLEEKSSNHKATSSNTCTNCSPILKTVEPRMVALESRLTRLETKLSTDVESIFLLLKSFEPLLREKSNAEAHHTSV